MSVCFAKLLSLNPLSLHQLCDYEPCEDELRLRVPEETSRAEARQTFPIAAFKRQILTREL